MAIPDYQTAMLPLLRFVSDGKEHSLKDCIEGLKKEFALSEEEANALLPSGKQTYFANRVGWAASYMFKAGLLEKPRRGHFKITKRGRDVLASGQTEINAKFLRKFPEFCEFFKPYNTRKTKPDEPSETVQDSSADTPEEALESAHQELKETLASDIIQTIMGCTSEFFERLVVDVLVTMGYGGSRKEAGQAVGKSSDGGIDGIIKEDRLGLDIIYIQAKRWESVVGRPEIQKFAGALLGNHAKKGIFITTSSFSKDAIEYVKHIEGKIILIDGVRLADLMIEHNVGTTTIATYEVKRLDSDYFIEE
jgi:restriction system protein